MSLILMFQFFLSSGSI